MMGTPTVLAVDLGGTKVLACVTRGGRIASSAKERTETGRGPAAVIRQVERVAHRALEGAGLSWRRVRAVGVAVPGAVDPRTGIVLEAPNLGWRRFPARTSLERVFGRRVAVVNDANAGLVGEAEHGALRRWRAQPLAGFFVGTGVGGALMQGGRLLTGAWGAAGEVGHMIVRSGGPRCGCGKRGCLEAPLPLAGGCGRWFCCPSYS